MEKINAAINSSNEFFYLERNELTETGVKYLSSVVENSQTLKNINLQSIQMTDKGALYLSAALERNENLEGIHLCWNKIKDKGVRNLSTAFEKKTLIKN